jgi:hypothetical protein
VVRLGRLLLPQLGAWNAAFAGGGVSLVLMVVIMLALPDINEVPAAFPTTVLWRFRLASLGTQLVRWTTAGLLVRALTERSLT